jgi:hypothetical protein
MTKLNTIPWKINKMLWGPDEEHFNRVGYSAPCISFAKMQIVRLVFLILLVVIWIFNFYINVKKCVIYLNFWAITFTVLALGYLFISSGRQVIERKLKERGDEVPEKEKCRNWKLGVFFYTIAWPLTIVSNFIFFTFVGDDQICLTFIDFGWLEWREIIIYMSVVSPLAALLVDLAMNRLVMSHKHLAINFILLVVYFFVFAVVGSAIQKFRPVYGPHLSYFRYNNVAMNFTPTEPITSSYM